jgi:ribosomal 50S subunit-recycling heat shock protein
MRDRREAHDAATDGRVVRGHRALKPGQRVEIGDELRIRYAHYELIIRILALPERPLRGGRAHACYAVLARTPYDPLAELSPP